MIVVELVVKEFAELSLDELYEILRLRVDVFVVEQKCPYREVDGADRTALHVFLRDDSGIQAYLRVMETSSRPDAAAIGRVIARKRRCGLGRQVLLAGIEAAKTRRNATEIVLEAQVYAREFYEKMGFKQVSKEFLEDGIPHIGMSLSLE